MIELFAMSLCIHNLSVYGLWCGASSGIIYVENWNISFDLKVGVHYKADKKYEKCLVCFKGQFQADSFLVEVIFILSSHVSGGDSLITYELDYVLLF